MECDKCNEIFAGIKKLKDHICRVHVTNPQYIDLYMKNWYRRGDCVPVFSERLKKELLILHSEDCWVTKHFCSEIPDDAETSEKSVIDDNDIIHTDATRRHGPFRQDDSVCWLEIVSLLKTHLPDYRSLC